MPSTYISDIPRSDTALRVAIAAGADKASEELLTGQSKNGLIDRVVGFAGSYTDNAIPFGPVVQGRRDDRYRVMDGGVDKKMGDNVVWRCAYYIHHLQHTKGAYGTYTFTGFVTPPPPTRGFLAQMKEDSVSQQGLGGAGGNDDNGGNGGNVDNPGNAGSVVVSKGPVARAKDTNNLDKLLDDNVKDDQQEQPHDPPQLPPTNPPTDSPAAS